MVNERITVINAPAGSGKTTRIETEIKSKITNKMTKKILCLTYTNRAVDELKSRIVDNYVDIYTIHSFFQHETKLIFHKSEIINLYINVFEDKITGEITNQQKITKYRNNFNIDDDKQVSINDIKDNIKMICYNEKNFSSYLYGNISHNDLLYFVYKINQNFDYFKVKLNGIYEVIYLDEYQDTDKYIISFLNDTINWKNSDLKLKLYGDKMQKIYGSENNLKDIEAKEEKINENFRSSNKLIDLLNSLYNQNEYMVKKQKNNKYKDENPIIEIYSDECNHTELKEESCMNLSSNYNEIFSIITGTPDILEIYNNLKRHDYKIYGYTSDLKASDLLMKIEEWDKDIILSNLKIIFNLHDAYFKNEYGKLINQIRYDKKLNNEIVNINSHSDREELSTKINKLFTEINMEENYEEFFKKYKELFKEDVKEEITESEINYKEHLDQIRIKDLWKLYCYITNSEKEYNISTQHGVKGESHSNVNLICADNKSSKIDYSTFWEYFVKYDIDIVKLEDEYEQLLKLKSELFKNIGIKNISDLKAPIFKNKIKDIETFNEKIKNSSFEQSSKFINDVDLSGVTKFKKTFDDLRKCERYILTFKIFYVGCSRAREQLIVKVNSSHINKMEKEFKEKMKQIGFKIKE